MIWFLKPIQNFEGRARIVGVENYKRKEVLSSVRSYSGKTELFHQLPSMFLNSRCNRKYLL